MSGDPLMSCPPPAEDATPVLEEHLAAGAGGPGQHRHFGYWIDRDWGRARCYECGFQFVGTDETAEEWQPL